MVYEGMGNILTQIPGGGGGGRGGYFDKSEMGFKKNLVSGIKTSKPYQYQTELQIKTKQPKKFID